MFKKNPWAVVGVMAVVAIGSAMYWSSVSAEKANEGVEITAHLKGNPDAEVTLIEYSDFQCPACALFETYVKDILIEYGDDVRFEYRHFPLVNIHSFAVPAAKAAESAAQQGKFFAMHDMLFENQETWSSAGTPQVYFVQYAEEIGLDTAQFKRQMRASIIQDAIESSFKEARDYGFTGTPSFLLNGVSMQFETFEDFRAQIETAIGVAPLTEGGETTDETAVSSTTTEPAPATTSAGPDVKFGF